jgi:hypothetical protein
MLKSRSKENNQQGRPGDEVSEINMAIEIFKCQQSKFYKDPSWLTWQMKDL